MSMFDSGRPPVVLSFDVEEHFRIEAAHGLPPVTPEVAAVHIERLKATTRELLALLKSADARATFFVVGAVAEALPQLVRDIAAAGHEIASHSHEHARIHRLTPETFLADAVKSRQVLEDVSGQQIVGYRAPTFSVTAQTDWAIDALVAAGYAYDSSVFPVRHDRYGSPNAPRSPFLAVGPTAEILELPPATLRLAGQNLPTAGGGYFRLFPLKVTYAGVNQLANESRPAMLYFHPWEFDPGHPRLALKRRSAIRTYVGVSKAVGRLTRLLSRYRGRFVTARELADQARHGPLVRFSLAEGRVLPPT